MNSYGGERKNEYEDEYEERDAGRESGRGMARASEVSSVGTRFIGNYAGSAANSEAGGRRSVSPFVVSRVAVLEWELMWLTVGARGEGEDQVGLRVQACAGPEPDHGA